MKYFSFLGTFLLSVFMFINVEAASGCCSSHGGVDCSKKQANGNVVCVDGWTGSTCSYSGMKKCQGSSPSVVGGSTKKKTTTPKKEVSGCMDKDAKNYNKNATKDSGNCIYYKEGCTDKDAFNYDSTAEKDDGSCIERVTGCMDEKAENYNSKANVSDGSCKYKEEETDKKEEEKESSTVGGVITLGAIGGLGYLGYRQMKKKKES